MCILIAVANEDFVSNSDVFSDDIWLPNDAALNNSVGGARQLPGDEASYLPKW